MTGAARLSARERGLALAVIALVPLDVILCGWLAVRRHAVAMVYAAPAIDAALLAGGVLFLVGKRAGGLRALGLTPRRLARLGAIALAAAGLSARLIGLPRTRQLFGAAAIAELAMVAAIALGFKRGLGGVLPERVLALGRAELALWPAAWRALSQRPIPVEERLLTVTRRSRWPQLVTMLVVVSLFEMMALHALLHAASLEAHLALAAVHLYGVVWLLADLRLLGEGGVRISDEDVEVKLGLRATAHIPREAICAARRSDGSKRRAPGVQRLTPVDAPNVELELARPIEITRALGLRRAATRVQLYVDEPERLLALLG